MAKKKATKENNLEFEEYIKNLDIDLATLEEKGAAFLSFGYFNYIITAQVDILEVNEMNNTGIKPQDLIVFAQSCVLVGYIILYIVSVQRSNEKALEMKVTEEAINLNPYSLIQFSYLISIFANYIRLVGFKEIQTENNTNIVIE